MRLLIKTLLLAFLSISISTAENKLNIYSGVFDHSDDGKRAGLIGIEYMNLSSIKNSFVGNIYPVSGVMITDDEAVYVYTGYQMNHNSDYITISPSFAVGYYDEGDGKDLGHEIEFKTQIQLLFEISSNSELGISYNHISNASLGDKNPGANSYMFNFTKKF